MSDCVTFFCSRCTTEFDVYTGDLDGPVSMYAPDLCQSCLQEDHETLELHFVCSDCDACGVISPKEDDILLRHGCSHCGGNVTVYE